MHRDSVGSLLILRTSDQEGPRLIGVDVIHDSHGVPRNQLVVVDVQFSLQVEILLQLSNEVPSMIYEFSGWVTPKGDDDTLVRIGSHDFSVRCFLVGRVELLEMLRQAKPFGPIANNLQSPGLTVRLFDNEEVTGFLRGVQLEPGVGYVLELLVPRHSPDVNVVAVNGFGDGLTPGTVTHRGSRPQEVPVSNAGFPNDYRPVWTDESVKSVFVTGWDPPRLVIHEVVSKDVALYASRSWQVDVEAGTIYCIVEPFDGKPFPCPTLRIETAVGKGSKLDKVIQQYVPLVR